MSHIYALCPTNTYSFKLYNFYLLRVKGRGFIAVRISSPLWYSVTVFSWCVHFLYACLKSWLEKDPAATTEFWTSDRRTKESSPLRHPLPSAREQGLLLETQNEHMSVQITHIDENKHRLCIKMEDMTAPKKGKPKRLYCHLVADYIIGH